MILRISSYTLCTVLLAGSLVLLASCSKTENRQTISSPTSSIQLEFSNYVGSAPLQRNVGSYTNTAGEAYTISRFMYYVSNFQLVDSAGNTVTLPVRYYLIDDAVDSTRKIVLDSVPQGRYTAVKWLLGVDSIRNVSGAQAGALAPENGMFWTWNSGYIMAKMEGHSPAATTALKEFQFHIGGFKQPYNALKTVTLPLPSAITVTAVNQPKIAFKADADKWFHTPNTVSIAAHSVIMAAGAPALAIAENYQQMFSVTSVAN
jgi:hypothetical protein